MNEEQKEFEDEVKGFNENEWNANGIFEQDYHRNFTSMVESTTDAIED